MYVYSEPLAKGFSSSLPWPLSSTTSNVHSQKVKWDQILIPHLLTFTFSPLIPGCLHWRHRKTTVWSRHLDCPARPLSIVRPLM